MKKHEGLYHYDACGLDNIYLKGGVQINIIDGEECVSIANLSGLHKAIANDLIKRDRPLTHKEFRFLRVELNLAQSDLAEKFGVNVQTIANYEKGKTAIPKLTDAVIRDLYKEGILQKILMESSHKKVSAKSTAKRVFEKTRTGYHLAKAA